MKIILVFTLIFQSFLLSAQSEKTLDDFISSAKSNSPILNDIKNQTYLLKLDSMKLRADYGPQVNGIADVNFAPHYHGWGFDPALSNGQSFNAYLRVSQQIIGKNNMDSRLESFNLSVQQILNQSKLTELNLQKAVTEQYILTYNSQKQYDILLEIIHLLHQEDKILKKLTQKAAFKQTDYLNFKVTLQQNELNLKQQYVNWLNNYAQLNYLSGMVSDTLFKLSKPEFSLNNIPTYNQSIFETTYQTDSLKIANDEKLIELQYRPQLSVYADGGYSSTLISQPYKNLGVGIGVSLNIPLYDGRKRQYAIQQNHIKQQTLESYNEFQKKQFEQKINQIQLQINQYNEMLNLAQNQLEYAHTLVEANSKQLPTGDIRIIDFILSIQNYITLKTSIVDYKNQLLLLDNQLNNLTL